jgi:phage terminase large subunit-like protein
VGAVRIGDRDYVAIGTQYARDVVAGTIPACKWVRLACQRQLDDLKRKGWTYRFDEAKAARVCAFIERLPHVKGRWKTATLYLEPWQCFFLTTIFGWVDAEGYRRFRKALIVIPRKNAKTTIAAGVGLYLLALDDEPGAEIYSAATSRDQAKISWDMAKRMAQRTAGFCERFGVDALAHSIAVENTASFFKPLSRDADSLEGLNPHGAIIDELHAHKTREVFDVLDEATAARQQPLIFIISTEGDNAAGVFAEQVAYSQLVLDGKHDDDSYFAITYTIDKEDDWTAPDAWRKANPNIGVSVLEKDLEIRCRQARKNAASQASFLTKRLNVRVGAGEAFFNLLAWEQICKDPALKIESFYGKPCYIGLDLASKEDIAAKAYIFPDGPLYYVFGAYYIPEDKLEREHPLYDVYRGWAAQDRLTLTPGNVIDFEFIERDLLEDYRNFDVKEIGYDVAQARQLATRMQAEGLPMIEVPQSVRTMSEPMKELGSRVVAGKIRHPGCPVASWMIGNVQAKPNAKEEVYPVKSQAQNKIDFPVALIIANSRAIVEQDNSISYSGLKFVG